MKSSRFDIVFRAKSSIWMLVLASSAIVISIGAPVSAQEEAEKTEQPRRLAIVTHVDNPNSVLSRAELGRMFLKKRTQWSNGDRCIPIDQAGTSEIRRQFYGMTLDRTVYDMKRYWMQETMTGNAKPPVSLENAATVKKYLEKIKGGIAYIYEDEVDDSVKVIRVRDMPELYSGDEVEGPDDATSRSSEKP